MGKIIKDGIVYAGTADSAAEIRYDNKSSGLKGKNVQTALDDLSTKIGDGGGITLTQAEYDALPEDQKVTGTYYITDADEIIDACLIGFNNKNTGLKSTNIQDVIVEVFRSGGTGGTSSGGGALSMHPLSVVATTENQTTFDIDLAGFDASADIVLVQSGRTMLFPNSDFTVVGSQVVLNEGVPIDRTIGIYVFKNAPVSGGGFGRLESYQFVIEAETNGQTTFTIPLETFDDTTDTLIVIDGQSVLLPNVGYTVAGRTITMTEPWSLGDGGGIIVLKSAAGNGDLGDITAEDIGALPITGGNLTGGLEFNGKSLIQQWTGDFGSGVLDLVSSKDDYGFNRTQLHIIDGNDLKGSLRLRKVIDSEDTGYNIYGEHNPPACNNNILINSNFANPVNQRNISYPFTNASSTFSFDRWGLRRCILNKTSNGITLCHDGVNGSEGTFNQRIEGDFIGKTISISCSVNGEILKYENLTITSGLSTYRSFGIDSVLKANIYYTTEFLQVGFVVFTTTPVTVEWMKVEIGEVATPYVPRLYPEELQLCQRYYHKGYAQVHPYHVGDNLIIAAVPIKCEIRVKPTVNVDSFVVYRNNQVVDGYTSSINSQFTDKFNITLTKTNHGYKWTDNMTVAVDYSIDAEL